jgi:hypothetical protein
MTPNRRRSSSWWGRFLTVCLQQAFGSSGDDDHGVQRDVVLVNPQQIGPRATPVLWWCGPFASKTDRIVALRVTRQHGFQAPRTDPVIHEIVDIAEMLPTVSAQSGQPHATRIVIAVGTTETRAAVCLAMDGRGCGQSGEASRSTRTRSAAWHGEWRETYRCA